MKREAAEKIKEEMKKLLGTEIEGRLELKLMNKIGKAFHAIFCV